MEPQGPGPAADQATQDRAGEKGLAERKLVGVPGWSALRLHRCNAVHLSLTLEVCWECLQCASWPGVLQVLCRKSNP